MIYLMAVDLSVNLNTVMGAVASVAIFWCFNYVIRTINKQSRQHKLTAINLEAMNYGLENVNGTFKGLGDDYKKRRKEKFDELIEKDEFLNRNLNKGTLNK